MQKLIHRVLVIPIDVERAFSILSHIRDQRRSQLTAYHIEGLLRIRINGPSPEKFLPLKYAKTWKGINTGDPLANRKNKIEVIETDLFDDELVPYTTEAEDIENDNEFFGEEDTDPIDTSAGNQKISKIWMRALCFRLKYIE